MKNLIIYLFICLQIVYADQGSIRGNVKDSKTSEPIPYANVFLSGTTIGSTTDENGNFVVKNIPKGKYKFIVSFVGYEQVTQNISIVDNKELKIECKLEKKTYQLNEITITEKYDEEYERNYLQFEKHFLGTSENAQNCEITNPEIIDLKHEDGKLIATSSDMVEIINHNLGFNIKVLLKIFEVTKQGEVYYSAEPFFQEIDTNDTETLQAWRENRVKAFNGSVRHFFKALYDDNLYSEGYRVYLSDKPTWEIVYDIIRHEQPSSYDLKSNVVFQSNGYKKLKMKDNLLIKYLREVESAEYYIYRERMGSKINEILPYQISWIEFINDECEFDENGLLRYPDNSIKLYGYWGWLKMGDLLPFDYPPASD